MRQLALGLTPIGFIRTSDDGSLQKVMLPLSLIGATARPHTFSYLGRDFQLGGHVCLSGMSYILSPSARSAGRDRHLDQAQAPSLAQSAARAHYAARYSHPQIGQNTECARMGRSTPEQFAVLQCNYGEMRGLVR